MIGRSSQGAGAVLGIYLSFRSVVLFLGSFDAMPKTRIGLGLTSQKSCSWCSRKMLEV